MPDLRAVNMRGFTAAVSRSDPGDRRGRAAHIAVGREGGADAPIALSIAHADGTVLVAYLSEAAVDRLAGLIADLVDAAADGVPHGATLQ